MKVEYDEYIREGTKASMFAALDKAPGRVVELLAAVRGGKINGLWYHGECCCMIGVLSGSNARTLISAHQARENAVACGLRVFDKEGHAYTQFSVALAENLFHGIRPGHTPANNKYCRYAEKCILDWMRLRGKSGLEEEGI